jgi:hypothetical protein
MSDVDPKLWKNFQTGFNKKLNVKTPEQEESERQKKIKEEALKALYQGTRPSKLNP